MRKEFKVSCGIWYLACIQVLQSQILVEDKYRQQSIASEPTYDVISAYGWTAYRELICHCWQYCSTSGIFAIMYNTLCRPFLFLQNVVSTGCQLALVPFLGGDTHFRADFDVAFFPRKSSLPSHRQGQCARYNRWWEANLVTLSEDSGGVHLLKDVTYKKCIWHLYVIFNMYSS